MAFDENKEKALKDFLRATAGRMERYGSKRRSELSDELLGEIEALLQTAVPQKYVYQNLGIHPSTWGTWKKKGDAIVEGLTKGDNPDLEWADLSDYDKRLAYFSFLIYKSKSHVILKNWRNMQKMSDDGTYKATEFMLRTLGGNDFQVQDHIVHHGVGGGGPRDEGIEEELAGFRPKDKEHLEETGE